MVASSSSSPLSSSLSGAQAPLAVVTGAGAGIGRALTAELLDRGCDVVAIDRDTASVDSRAERVELDVRDAEGMAKLAARFSGRPASHVFANAGVGGMPGDLLGLPDEAWQWVWDVNVLGALRTLRLWWPHLCAGRGKAVATLSPAGMMSFPGAGPYRASKAALLAALEGLHYQAKGSGVTVHAMCPGTVRTDILDLGRYPEAAAWPTPAGTAPNPFAAHVAAAMLAGEPPPAYATRVLRDLDAGAPFYWHTQPGSRAWIAGRHRAIEQGLQPFNDFGAPQ
jgi:2-keto-3-deoxy-L-fuconate dehydrogenase